MSGQLDEPALIAHWRAEGRTEYTVLAFVPGARPFDLFDPARKSKSKLYVRRVLISRDMELLPAWLRFVRIVVDSADIPLNVSREMVQKSPVAGAIGKAIATRILQELKKLADAEPEKFAEVWKNFGAVLKEGLHEDPSRRDDLFEIARFASTSSEEKTRTLKDYVADLRDNQTAIYYLVGDDMKRLRASPQLEGFRARGVEVLLARRRRRRLLGDERARLRGQAVQIGHAGSGRHRLDRARRRRARRRRRRRPTSPTCLRRSRKRSRNMSTTCAPRRD